MKFEAFEEELKFFSPAKRKMIYIMPSILIGILVMVLIYEDTTRAIEYEKARSRELQQKIANNSIPLLKAKIAKVEKEIKKMKGDILLTETNNLQIEAKLKELKFAFYDDLGFANNVKSILKASKDLNLTINYLKTKLPTPPKKGKNRSVKKKSNSDGYIKLIKNVEIDGVGKFKNIVTFIQFIEAINTLHDFSIIKIELDKKYNIHFYFLLDQYGIELGELK